MKFIVSDIKITNMAEESNFLFASNIHIKTKDGNIYSQTYVVDIQNELSSQDIEESSTIEGQLVYEIPLESHIDEIIYKELGKEVLSSIIPSNIITTVKNNSPVAIIQISGDLFIDSNILFTANNSYDPDSDSLEYIWDLGDPEWDYADTSTKSYTYYSYNHMGQYIITLKVIDLGGLEKIVTQTITISHYFILTIKDYGIEYNSTYHDGEWYFDVILSNKANDIKDVYAYGFDIKTSDGGIYSLSGTDGKYPDKLSGGSTATWRIYFDLTPDKIPIQLIYDDDLQCDI